MLEFTTRIEPKALPQFREGLFWLGPHRLTVAAHIEPQYEFEICGYEQHGARVVGRGCRRRLGNLALTGHACKCSDNGGGPGNPHDSSILAQSASRSPATICRTWLTITFTTSSMPRAELSMTLSL